MTCIHEFVEHNIYRSAMITEDWNYKAIVLEDMAELEMTSSEECQGCKPELTDFFCRVCDEKAIGDCDKDVFEHIRDIHPEVMGLIVDDLEEKSD